MAEGITSVRGSLTAGPGSDTMDDLTLEELAIADCAFLEDDCYVEDWDSAPEPITHNCVRLTQVYSDGVGMHCDDYIQREKNLEFDICRIWCSKPVSVLKEYCDAIKVFIFWPLLFQRQHGSLLTRLHPCVEANNSRACELSLAKLQHIELMEDIMDLAKKVVNDSFFIGSLLRIGYKIENKILAIEEAVNWLKFVGDITLLPKLGSLENCWPMLSIFFTEYKYHITKFVTEEYNLLEEFQTADCPDCTEQGEIMKIKGNEEFCKERFDLAIIYYTRAIEYRPENHLLYGNRALCFLRTGQFRSALGDGKRATILKSTWPKGHYRYCDALSLLGEHEWALKANIKAQELCKNDGEGLKELIEQHIKFQKQIDDLQGRTRGRSHFKRAYYGNRDYIPLSAPSFCASLNFVDLEKDSTYTVYEMASGGRRNRKLYYRGHKGAGEALKGNDLDDSEEAFYEYHLPSNKPPRHRGRHRSRNNEAKASSQVTVDLKRILEKQFSSKSSRASHQDFVTLMKMMRGLIQDGYTALSDQRCHCAVQAFTHLLNGLDPQKIKQLNLAMINYVLVVYGLGLSLLGIGKPEELSEAENQFRHILSSYPNEGLDCLAYCGIGTVYLKKNRFSEALNHFQTAREVIGNLPGVLTWPTTDVIIEETEPSKIRELLEKFIEECEFPPVPEGICSYHDHCGALKIQIYISDPDFKGFIRILCSHICKIDFHINCWKKLKATSYNDKPDKDFLNASCLTPDCQGIICKITVFNSYGGVKCEFEHKIIKERGPSRPIQKQKCSSLEKLKEKEEKKMKRKNQKEEAKKLAKERREEDLKESKPPKKEEKKGTVEYAQPSQFLDDRILQCIKQYSEKIKSGIPNTSTLMKELLSWKVLSVEDYTTCFSSRNFLSEAVDFVIQHLIKENSRVKTRIFLHVLSEHKEMEPQVASWIEKLNGFGLSAVGPFLTRYEASLKDLDFNILSSLWNEKYRHKLGSIEGKNFEYFLEPTSLKEARFLIWLLEDHREKFPTLHSALDEFFGILDSSCTVLRKHDNDDSMYVSPKAKNKGKKKKPKDLKPMLVGSGTPSIRPSVKSQTVTSSDKNKGSLESSGPFAVPEHLRKDIEEFEAYYKRRQQQKREYADRDKNMGETGPKQRLSTLYDYFSQYLEDNGPLDVRHRVFSDEYRFYPEETRQIVQKAGGLKQFLLRCPRFVVIDNCIALRTGSSRSKGKRKKKGIKEEVDEISSIDDKTYLPFFLPLNPDAKEFIPESGVSSAPVSENMVPEPASADSPSSAYEDMEPELASGGVSIPVAEDGEPKWIFSDSPQLVSESADHALVPCHSATPVSEDVNPTYWGQPQMVTGYCTYLPFQGFDITKTPPAFVNVLSGLPRYAGIYTPLGTISEYQLQNAIPVVTSFIAHDRPDPSAAAYFEGYCVNAESASGSQIASETQVLQGSLGTSLQSHSSLGDADTALKESGRNDGHYGKSASKGEGGRIRTRAATAHPPTQMAAVQVSCSVTDQEVNTEPYGRFEARPGDISRFEKEYRKLQVQLEDAYEKYEKTRFDGLAEIRDLEAMVKRSSEQCQASKTELESFIQDLEKETKKWQQERKETQEKLKALKKKVKRLSNASETCTQKNDEKDEEHGLHLDESLEIRNPLANEKAKLEERIKKSKENYEEVHERAVAAEISVLTCWKDIHVWKLEITKAQGEAYVDCLKIRRGEHEPSLVDAVLYEWESYFASVEEELETVDDQLEEKVNEVKSGSWFGEITKVLAHPIFEKYRPESSAPSGQQTEDHKDASACPENAPTEESEVARLLACAKKAVQEAQSKQSPVADQKPPCPPGRASRSNQSLKKPFNSIIEHLAAVFPCYSSSELAGFVKKVRTKSSLLGLSIDETVRRVIEHILAEQKKKPNPASDQRTSEPSCAAAAARPSGSQPSASARAAPRTQGQKREDGSATSMTASSTNSCEICHQALKSKSTCVLKCGHKFHSWCLKQWLRGQSTCPACCGHDQ
ncbi:E3 ubiquitin-protein ligase TTC3 [Elephas maximus indicus]|uniref:E3 ubiquitin-protein ligase TTC3 n=1 Tax=Elephas maximus indicus TaxID=99487 RepID=UPI002116DE15|nr:E3 ubiquitin-protein ligase TTC3 [Elephas maximus indicus]